jgi:hypothetical protein
MKRYYIKSDPGMVEYMDILGENNEGYKIRVTRITNGEERTLNEFMTYRLFDTCLKGKYLYMEKVAGRSSVA